MVKITLTEEMRELIVNDLETKRADLENSLEWYKEELRSFSSLFSDFTSKDFTFDCHKGLEALRFLSYINEITSAIQELEKEVMEQGALINEVSSYNSFEIKGAHEL